MKILPDLTGVSRRWYTQHDDSDVYCVVSQEGAAYRLSWVGGVWHGDQHHVLTFAQVQSACEAYPIICDLHTAKHQSSHILDYDDRLCMELYAPNIAVYSWGAGKHKHLMGHVAKYADLDALKLYNRDLIDGNLGVSVHAEQADFVAKKIDGYGAVSHG